VVVTKRVHIPARPPQVMAAYKLASMNRLLLPLEVEQRSLGEWIDLLSGSLKDMVATVEDVETENKVLRSDLKRIRSTNDSANYTLQLATDAARDDAKKAHEGNTATKENIKRMEKELELLRGEIRELANENEGLHLQVEQLQGQIAEADVTVDVHQHHLTGLQQSLDEAQLDMHRVRRERDTYKTQVQRQKAAFEDEIRAAHNKLIELQRARDKLLQPQKSPANDYAVGDTTLLKKALRESLQQTEALQTKLGAAQQEVRELSSKCQDQLEANQALIEKQF
jgi:chromosome segregation ATPase